MNLFVYINNQIQKLKKELIGFVGAAADPNNKGFFVDPAALQTAYPIGQNGWFAIVGTTDTFWVWDADTASWKDSGSQATGDVVGPNSSVDDRLVLFDQTTGKRIKDSGLKIADVVNQTSYTDKVKEGARVATTTNITLSGLQTIDGVTLNNSDRVLVHNQIDSKNNGLYYARVAAWERTYDFNNGTYAEILSGAIIRVEEGTVNAGKVFQLTSPGTGLNGLHNLGVDNIIFTNIFESQGEAMATAILDAVGTKPNHYATGWDALQAGHRSFLQIADITETNDWSLVLGVESLRIFNYGSHTITFDGARILKSFKDLEFNGNINIIYIPDADNKPFIRDDDTTDIIDFSFILIQGELNYTVTAGFQDCPFTKQCSVIGDGRLSIGVSTTGTGARARNGIYLNPSSNIPFITIAYASSEVSEVFINKGGRTKLNIIDNSSNTTRDTVIIDNQIGIIDGLELFGTGRIVVKNADEIRNLTASDTVFVIYKATGTKPILRDSRMDDLNLIGKWNASTNTPTLQDAPMLNVAAGDCYRVEVAGTQFGQTFNVGDLIRSNGVNLLRVVAGTRSKIDLIEFEALNPIIDNVQNVFNVEDYKSINTFNSKPIWKNTNFNAELIEFLSDEAIFDNCIFAEKLAIGSLTKNPSGVKMTNNKASTVVAPTFVNNAGVNFSRFGNDPIFEADVLPSVKAWASVNGSTVSFNSEQNCNTVSKPSTGTYDITYDEPLTNPIPIIGLATPVNSADQNRTHYPQLSNITTTGFTVKFPGDFGTNYNLMNCHFDFIVISK